MNVMRIDDIKDVREGDIITVTRDGGTITGPARRAGGLLWVAGFAVRWEGGTTSDWIKRADRVTIERPIPEGLVFRDREGELWARSDYPPSPRLHRIPVSAAVIAADHGKVEALVGPLEVVAWSTRLSPGARSGRPRPCQ